MNRIFIFLSCILIGLNLLFFHFNFIPVHDAKLTLDVFYVFYNEFFFHHHIAHWMPDHFYGTPAVYFQLTSLTAMSYVTGFIGSMFRVEDVFLLWKVSMALEQLIFLWGLYLLSKLLFTRRVVIVFVCLGGILSTLWWGEIYFNFRSFYMVPLVLFCFFTFFKRSRPEFLWLAGIAGLSALLGNSPYFSCLWFFCFCLIALVVSFWHGSAWKSLLDRRFTNYAAAVSFIILFLAYAYFASHVMDGQAIDTKGRDPLTGRCDLQTFLTHGGIPSVQMVICGFLFIVKGAITGHRPELLLDMFYIGLIPLVFFIWSLFRVRDPFYYAVLAVSTALVLLSFGGSFARWVYYFPMMSYVRHIGFFYGFIKVLILLCAGFGLEDFCRGRKMYLKILILAVFALDLLCYQKTIFTNGPFTTSKDMALVETYKVHREGYHPQRTLSSDGKTLRERQAMDLARYGDRFTSIYAHAQMDVCYPVYTNQFRTANIDRLARIDPSLPARAGGCYAPKLQLFADAQERVPSDEIGSIDVLDFNANALSVSVDVRRARGGWLFYADAYHPQWRASVDGQEAPVRLMNGAYKAVFATQGKHTVDFSFDHGPLAAAGTFFTVFGLLMGLVYCCLIVLTLI